jgi:hypothetical protein
MAKLPRATYTLKVGTSTVAVKLPDAYDGIASVVGLTKVTTVAADASHGDVSHLLRDAQIARVRISYRNTAGKYRTADIICDLDNYKSALGTLPGKPYRGSTIIDAFVPRRRRLG